MRIFEAKSFVECFRAASAYVLHSARRKSDMNEIQDIILKVSFSDEDAEELARFVEKVSSDDRFRFGLEKATRAYVREVDSITKPSYIGRLKDYCFIKPGSNDFAGIAQFDVLQRVVAETPQASNLVLAVHHPSDIEDGFRPGYVPCLSFIDVKYRHGSLSVKFFFRSCDFQEVLLYDLYFCIKIFEKIEAIFKENEKVVIEDRCAIFYFSRAFFYKRRSHLLQGVLDMADVG
ncbi:hypothetical protein P7228_11965 [Altererythrobacter arenosus]|uniref:Uncharacterized protein n=1 Tax=Altererythrobacter arenosus TaxID=3032592 RepID=A0ABY8FNW1_9SPHN|nr:hypothetical protein [Altererythrobacter sp. CAU 1644]WFL76709.1 hypothetical protein P7228_11965 [Altererythrobacter sp. CAU 1644]